MHLGSIDEGRRFFEERWPEVGAISDPDRSLYAAFGLQRGSVLQLLGPSVWKAGLEAFRRGHRAGRPIGDPFMMSGAFLIEGGRVLAELRHAHPGADREWGGWGALGRERRARGDDS